MTLASAFVRSGKVRDLYAVGDDRLLLVASDRLSAFDVVLPTPIPDKGKVLTGLSRFWFAQTAGIVPNHLLGTDPRGLEAAGGPSRGEAADLRGRTLICRRAEVLPVEVIVRGYLSGSGWLDYQQTGAIGGLRLPDGLRESDRLPEPILTPSTKAEGGAHDQNIGFDEMARIVGPILAERVRATALTLYRHGAAVAEAAGILLADTKFEFGRTPDGGLILIDEVMTPDSSRFWEAATYEPGRAQASYDKQFVRDWLLARAWDKTPPGPELPRDVVDGTRARYVEAFERITGASFARYLQEDVIAR
ncbi:MAG: phosphoribosylaminoimidazole-succinocarboxamide synthase [Chloroflexota bacterium]|jgi:phosphoribosylaminoimidazole-succinocarboxamide synthase|nr:phosphoribosylaminoimidazole-succinocarboxamide synthase [Chloroflexota bacterium]